MSPQNILVVDDEPDICSLVKEILIDEGYQVNVARDTKSAREHARAKRPDLVLLDIWMPEEDGISLLKEWQTTGLISCPVIMMSGHGTVETAVEATRLGAYDFIEKPLTMAKLLSTVRKALTPEDEIKDAEGKKRGVVAQELIGSSVMIQKLHEQAKKIAQHDSWILITGEPGVGKKTFARYVHSVGPRKSGPFISINAAELSEQDIVRKFFGYEEKGQIHKGVLEQCAGGVLYIEEIANLSTKGQRNLLQILQRSQYTRIGGTKVITTNVRMIASTSRELQSEARNGKFDEELFFRLNVVPVTIPPLRERAQDVPDLLNYYVDYYCSRENFPYRHFSIPAQNRLLHYTWPGNVRELRNLVQRLLILSAQEQITVDEVELALDSSTPDEGGSPGWYTKLFELPLREARESFERGYLLHQLKQTDGSISKLSERVGMERTHLYRKLKALGISTKE